MFRPRWLGRVPAPAEPRSSPPVAEPPGTPDRRADHPPSAPPGAGPAPLAARCSRVTEVGLADARGHVEPDEGEAPQRRFQPRVDAAPVVDVLDADARGTMIVMLPHPV